MNGQKQISADRKRELRNAYREYKPEMGILAVYNTLDRKVFLLPCPNLQARLNRCKIDGIKGFFHKQLQQDCETLGEAAFRVEILERLPYEKEEEGQLPKTDYKEDLELLALVCKDRLAAEGYEFYESSKIGIAE